uniref:Uncharacterized protein n=1 Tax=Sphaerodactylus townsendi TaxID=933632 RepID=A0ACB8G2Z6_9SAUR
MSNPSCPTSYEAKDPLLLAPYDEYSGGYPAGCSRADSQPPPYSVVYPQPGGYPQSVPPVETLSANFSDRPNSSGMAVDWDSKKVQHAFIRKVYSIISVQLLVTVGIVAIFIFVTPVTSFVQNNIAVYYGSYAVFLVTYLVLVCCEGLRALQLFVLLSDIEDCGDDRDVVTKTLAMAFMTGTISSMYSTKAVLLAMIITAIVAITVTVFSFQTKVDFTSCTGLFCVLAIVVMVTGIITAIVLSFKYVYWLHMLYAAIGAIVFTLVSKKLITY